MTDDFQGPVFVSREAARAVFNWTDAIRALQDSYARPAPASANPPRTVAREQKAWLRTLPSIPPGGRYFGAKLMGMDPAQKRGLDYVIVLYDRTTSRLSAFVDANTVTGFRTAATSAAALDKLAPNRPLKLGVLGSGLEASMHTRAFAAVRQLTDVTVFSSTPERREAFARMCKDELGANGVAVDTNEAAIRGADIVLAAARSRDESPILYADWLAPGATVVSIGSTVPEQREIDVSIVERSDIIVCDTLEEVLEETGDMLEAHKAGLKFHDKCFSLNDLMAGKLDDKVKAAKAPMFKSVGAGMQDIVVAEMILTKALEAGLTTRLPIQFESK